MTKSTTKEQYELTMELLLGIRNAIREDLPDCLIILTVDQEITIYPQKPPSKKDINPLYLWLTDQAQTLSIRNRERLLKKWTIIDPHFDPEDIAVEIHKYFIKEGYHT